MPGPWWWGSVMRSRKHFLQNNCWSISAWTRVCWGGNCAGASREGREKDKRREGRGRWCYTFGSNTTPACELTEGSCWWSWNIRQIMKSNPTLAVGGFQRCLEGTSKVVKADGGFWSECFGHMVRFTEQSLSNQNHLQAWHLSRCPIECRTSQEECITLWISVKKLFYKWNQSHH